MQRHAGKPYLLPRPSCQCTLQLHQRARDLVTNRYVALVVVMNRCGPRRGGLVMAIAVSTAAKASHEGGTAGGGGCGTGGTSGRHGSCG